MHCRRTHGVSWAVKAAALPMMFFAMIFVSCAFATQNDEDPLKIAVSANFSQPAKQIAALYTEKTGIPVRISVGSSGTLFAQISRGAQFDLFLSADSARPNALITSGKVNADDVFPYAKGQLALMVDANLFDMDTLNWQQLDDVFCGSSQRLAIANPAIAPYGVAAKKVLSQGNAWECAQASMVKGNNVIQAYQFFESGNVPVAFVARSLVVDRNDILEVPSHLHDPIVQSLAITALQDNKHRANAFVDFLLSAEIQQRLVALGYETIVEPGANE
ncbi:molybdate ABC transporter substrate-binding protein [Alteromonas sp. KUL49]|nr:molybdate ABC transporter substrate-binding protein [Alteromonas sp. KUL49]GEA12981.1 molybdate ABC transporter substrate-binding protein [Alteromonas sp. KUL49]